MTEFAAPMGYPVSCRYTNLDVDFSSRSHLILSSFAPVSIHALDSTLHFCQMRETRDSSRHVNSSAAPFRLSSGDDLVPWRWSRSRQSQGGCSSPSLGVDDRGVVVASLDYRLTPQIRVSELHEDLVALVSYAKRGALQSELATAGESTRLELDRSALSGSSVSGWIAY